MLPDGYVYTIDYDPLKYLSDEAIAALAALCAAAEDAGLLSES